MANVWVIEAIEIIKNQCSIWHEFVNTLGILNIKVQKDFTDHLQLLEKNPDQTLVESLLCVYQDKDNQPLFHALYDLSNWDRQTDPLANFALCYFSMPPSFELLYQRNREDIQVPRKGSQKSISGVFGK